MTRNCFEPKKNARKTASKAAAMLLAAMLALTALGCSSTSQDAGGPKTEDNEKGSTPASAEAFDLASLDLEFSDRDMDPSYDEGTATRVKLADSGIDVTGAGASVDGSVVTLSAGGTYVVEGELSNGSMVVQAGDEDKVQLVLAGVSVHNESGPAICVENADKCFITLAEGTQNSLSDGSEYELSGEDDNRDATVFSRDDLTINGAGSLSVAGSYKHAICSNDDLRITGGVMDVLSKEDAFRGKDCIKVAGGNMTVNAGDDAFHSDAFFYAKDGSIDVQSCYEGYEGEQVVIDGGSHSITASDDALNAAMSDSNGTAEGETAAGAMREGTDGGMQTGGGPGGTDGGMQAAGGPGGADGAMQAGNAPGGMAASSSSCIIQINGGVLNLVAGFDGIDSNGSVEINGGTVTVSGPDNGMDGSLDYDLDAKVNGGVVLMVGAVGNASGLDSSAQPVALGSVVGSKGQEVSLVGADGAVLATLTASESFSTVLASAPGVEAGQSLQIVVDGNATGLEAGLISSSQAGRAGDGAMQGGMRTPMEDGLQPPTEDGTRAPMEDGMQPPADGARRTSA